MTLTLWYKDAVFYEVYIRAFNDSNGDGHGDLPGLTEKLDYLQQLGVTCLWLLPIYPSPLKDDGYDIANYYDIHPDYGTLEDFKTLLDEAHKRDMRVITDLVLNHTSDEHPWFRASRANPDSVFRDYYVWSDSDQKYKDARIIFLDTEKSNWSFDEHSGQYFWHRFYSSQPDLNYDNPVVQDEMLKVLSFWLDLGVDGFRADAIPYLFEREGTNCENLPETHAFLKKVRHFINENYPGRILLAEANQWPEDVLPYFGNGDDEFHMGFHFPVMPRIYMALQKGDRSSLEWIMERTPPLGDNNQWCLFLRNHDELTLEMVTPEERDWMWNVYAPDPRMRLNLGIRRRLAPLLGNDRNKIELVNSMLFTLPGSPIIYYGDEIGMGDNIWLPDRNGVRTPMQWSADFNAGFSQASIQAIYAPVVESEGYSPDAINVEKQLNDENSLLNTIRHMIATRKQYKVFGWGNFKWADVGNKAVVAYTRNYENEHFFILNNLKNETLIVSLPETPDGYLDVLSGIRIDSKTIQIQPYQYLWLEQRN